MDARYARAMHLNPLLGEARVVDISNIKMDADERTIHLIEECPEFPGRQQEALFRIAVLATDFDSRLGCNRSKLLHGVETALVHLVESEEHTSELQSRLHLVCRLLLEKKKQDRRRSVTATS